MLFVCLNFTDGILYFTFFLKIIENLEDEEDYKLAEKIINNPNTKYTEGIEDLAKECGIDYDVL